MICNKKKFSNQEDAIRIGKKMINKHKTNYTRTYYCHDCDSWHLTTKFLDNGYKKMLLKIKQNADIQSIRKLRIGKIK